MDLPSPSDTSSPQVCKNHKEIIECVSLVLCSPHTGKYPERGCGVESEGKDDFTRYFAALSLEHWAGGRAGLGSGIPQPSLCWAPFSFSTSAWLSAVFTIMAVMYWEILSSPPLLLLGCFLQPHPCSHILGSNKAQKRFGLLISIWNAFSLDFCTCFSRGE